MIISDIPWAGPIGAVRVGRVNNEFIANPTYQQIAESDLDLRVAGTRDAILMVECGSDEISEDVMVEALVFAHKSIQPTIDVLDKMALEVGKPKREVEIKRLDEELINKVEQRASFRIYRNAGKTTYQS